MTEVKASRVPLRQRQALETRRAIAHAARSLFAEHGYAATSIEVVAAQAGVAERTVYAIFGTKKAILGAICEEWLNEAGDLRRRLALVAHSSRRQWDSYFVVRAMPDCALAPYTAVFQLPLL